MRCVAVIAKEPRPGQVKTRLAASIGAEAATDLCRAFLADTIAHLPEINCKRALYYAPETARRYFAELDPTAELLPQPRLSFGERLAQGFETLFLSGYGSVVFLGSDSPHIQPEEIEMAFEALERSDLVLGPSEDGGYYLIGMRKAQSELFEGIPWSTPVTFAATIERARALNLKTQCLKPSFDVDDLPSLGKLKELIASTPHKCPATFECLGRLRDATDS